MRTWFRLPMRSYTRPLLAVGLMLFVLVCVLTLRDSTQANPAGLSPLETRVLGESKWLARGPAAVRMIVTDHRDGDPISARVAVSLSKMQNGKPVGKPYPLYKGSTNRLGTVDAHFTAPDADPGQYQLTVSVNSSVGKDQIVQPIQLEDSVQVMLTADKPLYQPGQTMHLRALALDMATREAVGEGKVTFEAEDARGNKVFKKRVDISPLGIAAADFTLADEVNMGTYTLRAMLPQGQTEKKVRVERYVLPKFKVALTTDKPYYAPGDEVSGTVQADYFFGKPVTGGDVTIDVSTLDIGVSKLAEIKGKTDARGAYKFTYKLPDSFVGQPFEQGKAVVEFHGSLIDTADHLQEVFSSVPVVRDAVQIVLVPESRALVPGLQNRVFISASTADGTPLQQADLTITTNLTRTLTQRKTDEFGLATFEFVPGKEPVTITVKADGTDGKTGTVVRTLETGAQEGIILRANRTLVKVGERISVAVLSTMKGGTTYLDVLRNKQTILTKALDTKSGVASTFMNITPDMAGTLELRAYKILPNEEIIRDTQVLVVLPADDLIIDVTTNKKEYRPGEEATLHFTVTDPQKHPILAALGIAVVDESVFALSELQPGLEKVYFLLEKELMEPKYEIHGLKLLDVMPLDPMPLRPMQEDAARQRAAEMLLTAAPAGGDFDFQVNTYQQRWEKLKVEVMAEMAQALQKFTKAVQDYRQKTGASLTAEQGLFLLTREGYLKVSDLRDRWGNFYVTNLQGNKTYDNWFTLSSAGPDGKWDTADDIKDVNPYMRFAKDKNGAVILDAPMLEDQAAFGRAGAGGGPVPLLAPMAMPAGAMKAGIDMKPTETTATPPPDAGGEEPVRMREYFPETMYWNPELITDERGHAQVTIPMADSITTWRMSATANSARGQLGSMTAPLKVFQDFFVDIDLPVSLTQNDRVEIPVAVYNYLPEAQQVTVTLEQDTWFTLDGENVKVLDIGKDEVKVVYFPITVTSIGNFPLTVRAQGTQLADAIRRRIDVLPDGKEFRTAINDRLEGKVAKTVSIPNEAIDGASTIWVKLYPGAFSQVVEGLDGMLRMPNGCFEQTSSTTYPNILVLDYLKVAKKINPELQMKAEGYINTGYQRLVTFECKGGGFSWFGNDPAHQILTAYGLLEFTDMSRVHEVDPALISRTQQWLAGKQKADGTWEVTEQGIAEGIINRQTGTLRTTAYIAWALAESGYNGPQVGKAVQYVKAHRGEAKDAYTLAVILNLLTRVEKDGEATTAVAQQLIDMAKVTDKTACWESDTQTFTGAKAGGADLETTGMAAYGLVRWGRNSGFLNKVLLYLIQSKDSFGTWSTTQGTVWSLKALIYASSNAFGGGKGTVVVLANGQQAAKYTITEEDSDVMRQVDLASYLKEGENDIRLEYNGEGSLLYQIVGRYYIPWNLVEKAPGMQEPLSVGVEYDKTTLAQNDTATVTVTIKNVMEPRAVVEMPLIDVGLPPGFTPITESLDNAIQAKKISKYTVAARQIIIYIEKLDPGETITLQYQLKAKYPIKARTPQSRAYPYYNPEQAAVVAPTNIAVSR